MTDIYRMIDELHAIVTSPEFFKVRYPDAKEIKPGVYFWYKLYKDSVEMSFSKLTSDTFQLGASDFTLEWWTKDFSKVSKTRPTRTELN